MEKYHNKILNSFVFLGNDESFLWILVIGNYRCRDTQGLINIVYAWQRRHLM